MGKTFTRLKSPEQPKTSAFICHKQFQAIANALTDAIVTMDETGTILFMNEPTKDLFGFTADELVGEKFSQLIAPHYHTELERSFQLCLQARLVGTIDKVPEIEGAH